MENKLTARLEIRLSPERKSRLLGIASELGMNKSELVRIAIDDYFTRRLKEVGMVFFVRSMEFLQKNGIKDFNESLELITALQERYDLSYQSLKGCSRVSLMDDETFAHIIGTQLLRLRESSDA